MEIWELFNTTEDSHPIHLHLVRFQILDPQSIDVDAYRFEKQMRLLGSPIAPDPAESGWKDTAGSTIKRQVMGGSGCRFSSASSGTLHMA